MEEKKSKLQQRAGKMLIAFFLLMLALSLLSRAADSLTIPTVTVANVSKGYLQYHVEGEGRLYAEEEEYLKIPEGVRIDLVKVKKGQTVEKDEVLATYDMEYLKQHIEELDEAYQAATMEYETEVLTQKKTGDTVKSAKENYDKALEKNEKEKNDLAKAKEKYETKRKKIEEELEKSKKDDYDQALRKLEEAEEAYNDTKEKYEGLVEDAKESLEELNTEKERAIVNAKEALEDAQFTLQQLTRDYNNMITLLSAYQKSLKENDVYKIQDNLDQLLMNYFGYTEYTKMIENGTEYENEKYQTIINYASTYEMAVVNKDTEAEAKYYKILQEELTDIYKADETSRYTAQNNVTRLSKKYAETESDYDRTIKKKIEEISNLKEEQTKALTKAQKELNLQKADYEEVLAQVYERDEELESLEESYLLAQESYDAAGEALLDAGEELKKEKEMKGYQEKIDTYRLESLQLSVNKKQEELEKVKEIYLAGGVLKSSMDGVVTEFELTEHSITNGVEKVVLAPKKCYFEGTCKEKEREYLAIGDSVTAKLSTSSKEIFMEITDIRYDSAENNYVFKASLPEGEYIPGTTGTYDMYKNSEKFDSCVPMEAIREDGNGNYFVLIVVERSSILGNEETAYRIPVTVKKNDYKTAVIEGALSGEDEIIIGSSNVISEGDRIRVK